MTSVLNFNSSSSSEFAAQDKGTTSILSNAKNLPTFIIQPPSSINTSNILSKRFKNSDLGDLLMKKVKSQTANSSEVNSNNQSPTNKGLKQVIYDTSDNQSIQEESTSPAVSSFDTVEKLNFLMPQRSISTPVFSNLHLNKSANQSSQKQILNALDTLQKRLVEYQVLSLRDAILKAHLSQVPFMIPSLNSSEEKEKTISPVKKIISNLQNDDDELEVYYGEVEYPLLHLAPKGMQIEEVKKAKTASNKVKSAKNKKSAKIMSDCSSPSFEGDKQDDSLLESLTATRAGTQRSEPDMTINLRELSEQVAELIGQKNKKSKNDESSKSKKNQKKDKVQEKEKKQRGKKGAQDSLLSPVLKGKRMTERRKNKWQAQEEDELKI